MMTRPSVVLELMFVMLQMQLDSLVLSKQTHTHGHAYAQVLHKDTWILTVMNTHAQRTPPYLHTCDAHVEPGIK